MLMGIEQAPKKLLPIAPAVAAASLNWKVGDIVGFVEKEEPRPRQSMSNSRWYIVLTEPQMEFQVEDRIEDWLGLAVYCPKEIKLVRRNAVSHRPQQKPMLRGYVFAGFDVSVDTWKYIRTLRGVLRLFMVNQWEPVPVLDSIIERIRQKEASQALGPSRALPPLPQKVGDIVQIAEHASLAGMFGTITDIDNNKRRLVVEVDILGRPTPVNLKFTEITPVC